MQRSAEDDLRQLHAALSATLGDKIALPNDEVYKRSVGSYWSAQASSISPACIASPQSTEDVSLIMKILHQGRKDGHFVNFAIRGGGHTPFAGSASTTNGVTIDMRALNTITVSGDQSIMSVGAGALWGDVYRKADALGLSVIGGRGATIGVGGLITGGGISHYSAQRGFACDNVISYEFVTGDGTISYANKSQNPDLFAAFKGGSNNFGVVTRFDLAAFAGGDIWGGNVVYHGSAAGQLLDAFASADLGTPTADPHAALILSFSSVAGVGEFCSANVEYTKSTPNPPIFQPFTAAQPQLSNTLRVTNLTDIVTEFTKLQPSGRRQLYVTNTFHRGSGGQVVRDVYDLSKKAFAELPQTLGLTLSYCVQPVPRRGTGADGVANVMGLDDENAHESSEQQKGALVLCLFAFSWDNSAEDAQVEVTARKLNEDVTSLTKAQGMWHRWVYLNYAAYWQDPIGGYGEANKARLQAASKKHDPDGIFQKSVPGGFKLF